MRNMFPGTLVLLALILIFRNIMVSAGIRENHESMRWPIASAALAVAVLEGVRQSRS